MSPIPHPDPAIAASIAARKTVRRQLRERRRALTPSQRAEASQAAAAHIARMPWLKPGRRVGLYLSLSEEISTAPLIELARRRGCTIYVPRIVSRQQGMTAGRMVFTPLRPPWRRSRLGILEPQGAARMPLRSLDVLFMPLVGFDKHGHRIGMGAGYYDGALAYRRHRTSWRRPLLVGFALACQELPDIPHAVHDIPVDIVVTERGVHYARRQRLLHAAADSSNNQP